MKQMPRSVAPIIIEPNGVGANAYDIETPSPARRYCAGVIPSRDAAIS